MKEMDSRRSIVILLYTETDTAGEGVRESSGRGSWVELMSLLLGQ